MKDKKKNFLLPSWYVTGITDAEGCFNLTNTHKRYVEYKVTQKVSSIDVLYYLQKFFGCGPVVIDNRKNNTYKYPVTSQADLQNYIFPHFKNFPLLTSKQLNFIDLMNNDRDYMGKNRKFKDKYEFLKNSIININPYWLLGFIDGEATFNVQTGWRREKSKYFEVVLSLEIGQSNHDVLVLSAIKSFFGKGFRSPSFNIYDIQEVLASRSVSRYKLKNPEVVIGYIKNLNVPLLTTKWLDYKDWCKIYNLKKEKAHLTEEGRSQLLKIKNGMNRNRFMPIVI